MKQIGYILGLGLLGLSALGVFGGAEPTPAPTSQVASPSRAVVPVNPPANDFSTQVEATPVKPTPAPQKVVPLSNDNHYTNVDGNEVHSPAYAPSVPPGASARCRDGTYSFSQNRRGTCSHHGGVETWL